MHINSFSAPCYALSSTHNGIIDIIMWANECIPSAADEAYILTDDAIVTRMNGHPC